jgi:serine/threonine protein kinase/tetratricopeptide (TPR) repeat protein
MALLDSSYRAERMSQFGDESRLCTGGFYSDTPCRVLFGGNPSSSRMNHVTEQVENDSPHDGAARWQQVERIYLAALEEAEGSRSGLLDRLCGGNADLRHEVEALLATTPEATAFLTRPAVEVVARLMSGSSDETTSSTFDLIGRQIGVYTIEKTIGAGGMGTVYRARDTKLPRSVAIKVLSDDGTDVTARQRFRREARLASSLDHPHILTVHDAGDFDGRPYLVTELVDGGTLMDWSKTRPRPWREIVDLLVGIADAIAMAHERGIVHRDLKPDNILVTRSGYAKLSDFGLAKLFERDTSQPQTAAEPSQTGVVLGTVGYMSPEQATGQRVDARTDIFSFGVVLHELLSGRRPFARNNTVEELHAIVHAPPPALPEDVPLPLRALVDKTLEKDPGQRYQTMREVVVELRRLLRESASGTVTPHAPRRPRPRMRAAAAVAVATVVAIAGAAELTRSRIAPTTDPQIRSIAVLPLRNLSSDPQQEYFSDGATEALITSLAQIRDLRVISWTSVMRYKSPTTRTIPEIGRELHVDAIVEGSVQRVDRRVRITAQLIRAATDTHVWAKEFDRDMTDVLQLQANVAGAIADEIRIQITPAERRRLSSQRPVDPDAYTEYLRGWHLLRKGDEQSVRQAVQAFERAIARQPDYPLAHAALARGWLRLSGWEMAEVSPRVRAAARKALELDPNLPEAHEALGGLAADEFDWATAEAEYDKARALDPNNCTCAPLLFSVLGRHGEAVTEAERILQRDPLSAEAHFNASAVFIMARRYAEAERQARLTLDLEPQHFGAPVIVAQALVLTGRKEEAFQILNRPPYLSSPFLAWAQAAAGHRQEAKSMLAEIERRPPVDSQTVALAYVELREKEQALRWLEKAIKERNSYARYTAVNPSLDFLRSDPRFQALVAQLKLPT